MGLPFIPATWAQEKSSHRSMFLFCIHQHRNHLCCVHVTCLINNFPRIFLLRSKLMLLCKTTLSAYSSGIFLLLYYDSKALTQLMALFFFFDRLLSYKMIQRIELWFNWLSISMQMRRASHCCVRNLCSCCCINFPIENIFICMG